MSPSCHCSLRKTVFCAKTMQINAGSRSAWVSPVALNQRQRWFLQELGKDTKHILSLLLLWLFALWVIWPNPLSLRFQDTWISFWASLLCDSWGMRDVMFGVLSWKAVDSSSADVLFQGFLPQASADCSHTSVFDCSITFKDLTFVWRSWHMLKELLKDMTTPREFYIAGPHWKGTWTFEHLHVFPKWHHCSFTWTWWRPTSFYCSAKERTFIFNDVFWSMRTIFCQLTRTIFSDVYWCSGFFHLRAFAYQHFKNEIKIYQNK